MPDIARFYEELHASLKDRQGLAYRCYGEEHSYPELYAAACSVARALQERRRERVVLYAGKGFSTYAAIYAVLLTGNVWIPMTPEQAPARNLDILRMTGSRLILTDRDLPPELAAHCAEAGIAVLSLVEIAGAGAGPAPAIVPPSFAPDHEAYIMFTSGSTGVPKGVPMTHVNYINFVRSALDILPLSAGDVFSDYHDFAFDLSVFYVFCCPLVGGAFAPVLSQADKIVPLKFIREHKVTVWSSVPSVIARVAQMQPENEVPTSIRIAFLCGEPFSLNILRYCLDNMKVPNVYNFYGLTETGVENFHHRCAREDLERFQAQGYVPIGLPLPGNDVRISEAKELLIAGCQITPGYLDGVGTERFEMIDGVRWYHTGDIVEQVYGLFFCKGRMDSQIKLSGYRIELMDVEVNIKRQPGVAEAICFVDENGGRRRLAAAIKAKPDVILDMKSIRRVLTEVLPAYMVPARMVEIHDVPLNQNGKVDRRSVKDMFSE